MTSYCNMREDCRADWHEGGCKSLPSNQRPTRYGNNDANGWRVGPAEWDYMHRYDSPDNERDSMG